MLGRLAFVAVSFSMANAATAAATAPALPKPIERRLHPTEVVSSSFLWNDWNKFQENYHPSYVADGDPKTAWVEGVSGTGAGEWIRLKLTPLNDTTSVRLVVHNGYQKSADLFAANARPKEVVIKLLPSGVEVKHTFGAKMGREEIRIEQLAGLVDAVELKIVSVTEGRKYEDTCISDIDVFVTSTTPENPAFEKSHFDRLVTWKKERKAAAALFSKTQKEKLPLGPRYVFTPHELPSAFSGNGTIEWMTSLLNALPPSMTSTHAASIAFARDVVANPNTLRPVDVVAKDARPIPPVDGVCAFEVEGYCPAPIELPSQLGMLNTSGFGVFDIKKSPTLSDALAATAAACQQTTASSLAWSISAAASADAPPRTTAVFLVECRLTCSRSGLSPQARGQLLVYDEQGRLDLIVADTRVATLDWGKDGVLAGAEVRSSYGEEGSGVVSLATTVAEK
jgi:hypothetical protein